MAYDHDRRRPQHPPAHWNSYRPNYDDRDDEPPARWDTYRPNYEDRDDEPPARRRSTDRVDYSRSASVSTRGRGAPSTSHYSSEDSYAEYDNLNKVPVRPRARRRRPEPDEEEDGPQLWDAKLYDLMNRTRRAYDLVINYARDCPEGKRWSEEHIWLVRSTGQNLHDDVRNLKVGEDVENVRELCESVQRVIKETEHEVRDRVFKPAENVDNEVEMADKGRAAAEYAGRGSPDYTQSSQNHGNPRRHRLNIGMLTTLESQLEVRRTTRGAHAFHHLDDLSTASEVTPTAPDRPPTPKSPIDLIERALLADWASMTSTARQRRLVW
tara:strand:- start:442 stop:1416 length:975 start_codon:yes stop_codon:yes gene_type:complete